MKCSYLCFFVFLAMLGKPFAYSNELEYPYCGINSVYIALKFFKKDSHSLKYLDIVDKFPSVEKNGVSLAQIKDFLESLKYHCVLMRISEEEIAKINPEVVFFVLKKDVTPHILLKKSKKEGCLQVIDAPYNLVNKNSEALSHEKYTTLAVSLNKDMIPINNSKWVYLLVGIVFSGAIFLVGYSGCLGWRFFVKN